MPQNQDEMREKVADFEAKYSCIQVFSCIDIVLKTYPYQKTTRKFPRLFLLQRLFSINVQAVCHYRGQFMDVDCRWPGSVHDVKVFANSAINKKLRDDELPVTYQQLITGRCKVGCHLIDDPAYSLTPYCMKEYQTCTSDSQAIFNNILRLARNPVECAFGRLKKKPI